MCGEIGVSVCVGRKGDSLKMASTVRQMQNKPLINCVTALLNSKISSNLEFSFSLQN